MKPFVSLLRELHRRLDLPQPAKSRVLLEIAADVEDLYSTYLEKGIPEAEAVQRVEEKFDLTDEALDELVHIHRSPMKRWLDGFSAQGQTKLERVVLVMLLLAMGVLAAQTLGQAHFFRQAGPFVLPMVGLALYATARALKKVFDLYIRQDHDVRRLRQGLAFPLILGGVNLLIGALGYFWELLKNGDWAVLLASEQIYLLPPQEPASRQTAYLVVDWMAQNAATMMVCFLVSLYTALIWYGLTHEVSRIETLEAVTLLDNPKE